MIKRSHIIVLVGLVAMLAMLLVAGCGSEKTTTTASQAPQCDPSAPSIIPAPSGKPQLVEFFRDT